MVRTNPGREQRRESRLIRGVTLSRVIEVVCASYEIDRSELRRLRRERRWLISRGVLRR